MIRAVETAGSFGLHVLDDGLYVTAGPELARARGGALEHLRDHRAPGPIGRVAGRFPDAAWASMTTGWVAGPSPVPQTMIARATPSGWEPDRRLGAIFPFASGVLARGADVPVWQPDLIWADGRPDPLPRFEDPTRSFALEARLGDAHQAPGTTVVSIRASMDDVTSLEYFRFDRGASVGRPVAIVPPTGPHGYALFAARPDGALVAVGHRAHGGPFAAMERGGALHALPAPPGTPDAVAVWGEGFVASVRAPGRPEAWLALWDGRGYRLVEVGGGGPVMNVALASEPAGSVWIAAQRPAGSVLGVLEA